MRLTVKLGGSLLEEDDIRQSILGQVASLAQQGHEIVLVHGGGRRLSRRLGQLGIESRFVDGLRVTEAATLSTAVMVLAGEVNKMIVAELAARQCSALGICGADGGAVLCRRFEELPDAPKGLGFVGKPVALNGEFFRLIMGSGLVPVVASIALGPDYRLYNVNADQMAAICAWGTGSTALIYLTDVPGVRGRDGTVQKELDQGAIESLRREGFITGGMLPKTASCLEALRQGVPSVFILPGSSGRILNGIVDGESVGGTHIHGSE